MPEPAPEWADENEGDDGAIHAFYAWVERRRGRPLDLDDVAELEQAIADYEASR